LGTVLNIFFSFVAEDKFAWLRDDEFARQALAGINPVNIERLQVTRPCHATSQTAEPEEPKCRAERRRDTDPFECSVPTSRHSRR
jgi:hypothetical protein